MKVQSTGLGKTLMIAHFKDLLKTDFQSQQVIQATMEAVEPLHWTIKVYMEPKDIRNAVFMGLKKPSLVWKILLALVLGRFSIFSRAKPEGATEPAPAAPPKPPSAPSPLAALKGEDEPSNPLSRLKG
jgi:hypothetical protein